MSRIASVKETGEEVSQADWDRFEEAVQTEVARRGEPAASQPEEQPSPQTPQDGQAPQDGQTR